jgi:hypothetical protein
MDPAATSADQHDGQNRERSQRDDRDRPPPPVVRRHAPPPHRMVGSEEGRTSRRFA